MELGADTLLIVDEAHHQGGRSAQAALPSLARYRLALSATPERHNDDEGTAFLKEYFGPVVFEYSMGDAIANRHLCEYDYYPRVGELSEEETELYQSLSQKIGAALARGDSIDAADDSILGKLLRDRANILGHAASKIPMFIQDLKEHQMESHQLVYCAEGKPLVNPGHESQLTMLTRVLGTEMGFKVHSYFSDTDPQLRQELLKRFAAADTLNVLTSMRCLDEGVDVPQAKIGYILASSTNPRQFIQRRGRLLRPAANKKFAVIYDYLVIPPPLGPGAGDRAERQLVKRELARALEFSMLSRNRGYALDVLRPVKERFNLFSL
jgi:superfamily II DNA or RNA helicase